MKRTLKGKLTISRIMSNNTDDYIEIRIEDEISGIEFVSIELSMEQYGNAVAGTSYQDIEYTTCGLDNIGKEKERVRSQYTLPKEIGYDRKAAEKYIKANCQREGWMLDSYLGSQNSITFGAEGHVANFYYYRYVTPEVAVDPAEYESI